MFAGKHVTPTLRLVRLLGQGAMGSVWVADHLALETQVAVKFVMPAFAQDPGFVERFRREALAAAKIKGANIAQVFDHGVTAEGQPFIVMELVEGEDLRKRITREGPLDCKTVAAMVHQIAKALTRAHQLGIVHRDIKPDNLFLTESDGELLVKVLDFGVAKVGMDDVTMTASGAMMGTPLYMSPEQFLSTKHVDFRADLWSLGAVVYHALTGAPPFPGETLGAISVAVHTSAAPKASAVRPDLPPEIDAWFAKAFCRDPAGRFPSAKRMAEELDEVARQCSSTLSSSASASGGGTVMLETMVRGPMSSLSGAVHSASAAPASTQGGVATSQTRNRISWKPAIVVTAILLGASALGTGGWVEYSRRSAAALGAERSSEPTTLDRDAMAEGSSTARATEQMPSPSSTIALDAPPVATPSTTPAEPKAPLDKGGQGIKQPEVGPQPAQRPVDGRGAPRPATTQPTPMPTVDPAPPPAVVPKPTATTEPAMPQPTAVAPPGPARLPEAGF